MQSRIPARLRSSKLVAVAPGVVAAGATTAAALAATPKTAQPVRATFHRHNVLDGQRVPISGRLLTGEAGRTVVLQVKTGHGWRNAKKARTGPRGRFHLVFRPQRLGRYRMRVRLVGPPAAAAASAAAARSSGRVMVYRASAASWYGPGFIGGRTACGSTLTSHTLGVANRTLPCGTRVTFYYHGHRVTARVVDRGPYVYSRTWDLTPAVKKRLHFPSTGTVWSTR